MKTMNVLSALAVVLVTTLPAAAQGLGRDNDAYRHGQPVSVTQYRPVAQTQCLPVPVVTRSVPVRVERHPVAPAVYRPQQRRDFRNTWTVHEQAFRRPVHEQVIYRPATVAVRPVSVHVPQAQLTFQLHL